MPILAFRPRLPLRMPELIRFSFVVFGCYLLLRTVQVVYRLRVARARVQEERAQIVLILGGEKEREYAGVELVRRGIMDGIGLAVMTTGLKWTNHSAGVESAGRHHFAFIDDLHTLVALSHPPSFLIVSSGHFRSSHPIFDPIRVPGQSAGDDAASTASPLYSSHRFIVDHQAIDTVTNFTTLAKRLAAAATSSHSESNSVRGDHSPMHENDATGLDLPPHLLPVKHIYVLTAAYHMPRSLAIGRIVLEAGFGIGITPIRIEDPNSAREAMPSTNMSASLLACHGAVFSSAARSESFYRTCRDALRALLWLYFGIDGTWMSRLVHPSRWHRAERQQREQQAQTSSKR